MNAVTEGRFLTDARDIPATRFEQIVLAVKVTYEQQEVKPAYVACGRVYLDLGKIRVSSKHMQALSKHGLNMVSRPNCSYRCVYIGYDNATGTVWAKALKMAKVFNRLGVSCFADADED